MPDKLDPKLKEIYQRVMGTPTSPATPPPPPSPANQAMPPPIPPKPTQPQPVSAPFAAAAPIVMPTPAVMPGQTVQNPSLNQTPVKQKKGISKLFLITVAGFIFLIAYTFMWIKLFNLRLPFLPF